MKITGKFPVFASFVLAAAVAVALAQTQPNGANGATRIVATGPAATATAPAAVTAAKVSDADAFSQMMRSQMLLVGKIKSAQVTSLKESFPPIYDMRLTLDAPTSLRGRLPAKPAVEYSETTVNEPKFPPDKDYIIAASQLGGKWKVEWIKPATAALLEDAKLAGSLPIGWAVEDGKIVSPWASLGAKAWPAGATLRAESLYACSKTVRPALLARAAVAMTVQMVSADDADAKAGRPASSHLVLTITNKAKGDVQVPALLTDGKTILWADSLVVLDSGGRAHILPGAGQAKDGVKSVTLISGQSLQTVYTVKSLKEIKQPKGASGAFVTFCLGDASVRALLDPPANPDQPVRN